MLKDRILLVEDEPIVRFGIRDFLENRGFKVDEAGNMEQARTLYQRTRPDAVVLDYRLPDGDALDFLQELHGTDPQLPVVLLTGHGSIDLAVRAIKEGAENFLTKPVELATLSVILTRALENQRNRRKQAVRARPDRSGHDPFVGTSAAIRALQQEVAVALRSEGPVLILGETGSGKGVLARWIHDHGSRREEAFVDLNCAGLAREFLESELFGHARGAFTGAVADKRGLFEVAHRGTLFLDEIGDFDPALQPKVLKVLEEKRFRRMAEVADRSVDVFLVAATNHDLQKLVREGRFRSDLYFRISTIPILIPPLRQRREDIPPLANRLLAQLARDLARPEVRLSPAALQALQSYPWPGNLRELRNILERSVLRAGGPEIEVSDLHFATGLAEAPGAGGEQTLADLERLQIEKVLQEERGRVVNAARRLGIPRSTLYQKIKEHSVDLSRFQG
ncbi:MAG TPA: sigma-54 dependent transcriptional regulator [Thermoanaerobaculia bacterium]